MKYRIRFITGFILAGGLGFVLGALSVKTFDHAMAGVTGEASSAEAASAAMFQGEGCKMRLAIVNTVPARRADGGVDLQVDWRVTSIGEAACPAANYIKSIEYKLNVTPFFDALATGEAKSFKVPGDCPPNLRNGNCSTKVTLPSAGRAIVAVRAELRATAIGQITGGDVASRVPVR